MPCIPFQFGGLRGSIVFDREPGSHAVVATVQVSAIRERLVLTADQERELAAFFGGEGR